MRSFSVAIAAYLLSVGYGASAATEAEFWKFDDAYTCDPGKDLDDFIESGILVHADYSFELTPPLVPDELMDRFRDTTYRVSPNDSGGQIVARTPVHLHWGPLEVSYIEREVVIPGVKGNFSIAFREPMSKVQDYLNAEGFAIRANSTRTLSDDEFSVYTLQVSLSEDESGRPTLSCYLG